jgi:flavin reductase (DIM6/NTAB) family NADH-FMN oxidoreductase RutF
MDEKGTRVAISADAFKEALARWASGVTIITTRSGDRIHGMTVSDFGGASLSPPLVTVCASKDSITTGLIAEGKCFGVNVLTVEQQDLSNRFASKKLEHERFVGLETVELETGAPLLPDALVNLDCRLAATHDAGDHVIYVGEIVASVARDGEPLVYYHGAYGRIAR